LAAVLSPAVMVSAAPTPQIKFRAKTVGLDVSCEMVFSVFEQLEEFRTFELCAKSGYVFPMLASATVQIRGKDEKDVRTWEVARSDDGDRIVFRIDERKPVTNGKYTFAFQFADSVGSSLVSASLCASVALAPGKSLVMWSKVVDDHAGQMPQIRLDLSSLGFNRVGLLLEQGAVAKLLVDVDPAFAGMEYELQISNSRFGLGLANQTTLAVAPSAASDEQLKLLMSCFSYPSGKVNREGRSDLLPVIDTTPLKVAKVSTGLDFEVRLMLKRNGEQWMASKPLKISVVPKGAKLARN
jgi:hypothetical protein